MPPEPHKAVSQSLSLGEKSLLDRAEPAVRRRSFIAVIAGIGPGILVMLADTDAGNVVTAAASARADKLRSSAAASVLRAGSFCTVRHPAVAQTSPASLMATRPPSRSPRMTGFS